MDRISPAEPLDASWRGARPPSWPPLLANAGLRHLGGSDDPKACVRATQARRRVSDEHADVCFGPWPSLGVVTIVPDSYTVSASQLEEEQNILSPSVGHELHAAPSVLKLFSF